MAENPDQPREYDAVLAGQAPLPADGVVLGGLEGVKQRLERGALKQRIDALLDTFEYGQEGLELVMQALEDTSLDVSSSAYLLLQDSTEPRAKQALWEYNPYKHFKCLHTLEGHTEYLWCLVISPDGQTLVSGCYDIVKVWDLRSGQLICTLNLYRPVIAFRIVISPDWQTLVSDYEGRIEVWELWTGQKIRTFKADDVGSLAITPNGQTLICGGSRNCHYPRWQDSVAGGVNNTIKVWNVRTGQELCTLEGHSSQVKHIAISHDQQTIVSYSTDNTINVWGMP